MDPKFAKVRSDPFAPELLRNSRRSAASAEEVRHEITLVGTGKNEFFE